MRKDMSTTQFGGDKSAGSQAAGVKPPMRDDLKYVSDTPEGWNRDANPVHKK